MTFFLQALDVGEFAKSLDRSLLLGFSLSYHSDSMSQLIKGVRKGGLGWG